MAACGRPAKACKLTCTSPRPRLLCLVSSRAHEACPSLYAIFRIHDYETRVRWMWVAKRRRKRKRDVIGARRVTVTRNHRDDLRRRIMSADTLARCASGTSPCEDVLELLDTLPAFKCDRCYFCLDSIYYLVSRMRSACALAYASEVFLR